MKRRNSRNKFREINRVFFFRWESKYVLRLHRRDYKANTSSGERITFSKCSTFFRDMVYRGDKVAIRYEGKPSPIKYVIKNERPEG